MNAYERALSLKDELVAWRRQIHTNPEAGPEQPETVAFVMQKLESFGLKPKQLGGGVVALVEGAKPGKTILLRADMDALFMDECSGLPFCSKKKGMNHACGHDMHTAMLLGAAKILSERRDEIHGCVKLCFQPAEEIGAGAERMIEAGVLENPKVDAAMGLHMAVATQLPTGTVAISPGVTLASNDMFRITVHGRGSHGARPETSIDPINIVCHLHTLLQAINSREIAPQETFVLTIGQIGGGSTANSIPDEAFLRGTIRTLNSDTRAFVKKRLVDIVTKTADAMRATVDIDFETELPPLVNDTAMVREMQSYLREILPAEQVQDMPTRMGSEDFAKVTALVPGIFAFLSGGSAAEGYTTGSHNPKVIYNEDSMPAGAATTAHCAIRWLENHAEGDKQS